MSIVTTQRTNQQALANLEVELGRLQEHVEEVDDHLRGVAGKESLDTRVTLIERDSHKDSVLLHQMVKKFDALERAITTQLNGITSDLTNMKFQEVLEDKVNKTKSERFKEWMKLWGATIIAVLSFATAVTTVAVENWDKLSSSFHSRKSDSYSDQWVAAIEKQKHDPKEKKRLREKYGEDVD